MVGGGCMCEAKDKKEMGGGGGWGCMCEVTYTCRVREWICYLHCLLPEEPISVLKSCFSGSYWSLLLGSRK